MEAAIDELPDDQFTVNIRWHPFFLGGTSSLAQYPNGKPKNSVGSGNVSARLKAAGSNVGIDFTGLTDRYPNSVLAHSLLSYVLDKDGALIQNKLSEVVFKHYFTEGKYPDQTNLLEAAFEAGVTDPATALSSAADLSRQAGVIKEAESYSDGGISGVPYFVINGTPCGSGAMPASTFKNLLQSAS